MTSLKSLIEQRVASDGPMTMADFMAECLLHPTLGYYTTAVPFGRDGDFITAPEISQMFGELVGLCLAQAWLDQGAPAPFALVELGPGRGTLMADILRATARVPGLHAAMQVHLVEVSPRLRHEQVRALAGIAVTHHDHLETVPDLPLFLMANEFFDALPVRQFLRSNAGWNERLIGLQQGQLGFGLSDQIPPSLLPERFEATPPGTIVEICPQAGSVMMDIGARLRKRGGLALIIDYGDWRSRGDTVQAMRHHAYVDLFDTPGQADVTAHVDFEALALAAQDVPHRYATQGQFLIELGIQARAEILARKLTGPGLQNHLSALRRLTHNAEMGTLFKVLALFGPNAPAPAGFSVQD